MQLSLVPGEPMHGQRFTLSGIPSHACRRELPGRDGCGGTPSTQVPS